MYRPCDETFARNGFASYQYGCLGLGDGVDEFEYLKHLGMLRDDLVNLLHSFATPFYSGTCLKQLPNTAFECIGRI